MPDEKALAGKNVAASGEAAVRIPLSWRAVEFMGRAWRPAATVVVVMLVLLMGWHAFYGKNGVSVWEQKRVEDRQLRKEIDDLQQENRACAPASSSSRPTPTPSARWRATNCTTPSPMR
jgi:hypothetical protein